MTQVLLAGNAVTADILNTYLSTDSRYQVIGLTVDDEYVNKGKVEGVKSIPVSQLLDSFSPNDCVVIMAMGYDNLNQSRESMFHRLKEMGYEVETYVHPEAHVYTQHPLGEGCVILPGTVIEPHVRLGVNTMIWCNVTVAHHSKVAEHCWIASGTVLSGSSSIGRNSFIGVNATVVNEKKVEEYNIVGAGALISKDTKPSKVHLARSAEEFRFSSQEYVKYFGV